VHGCEQSVYLQLLTPHNRLPYCEAKYWQLRAIYAEYSLQKPLHFAPTPPCSVAKLARSQAALVVYCPA
jgi:hypothetical protein